MPKTYPAGQAPWETPSQSFPIGQAPWELQPQQQPTDLFGKITGTAQKVTDFLGLHGVTETEGTNLANVIYTGLMERTSGPQTTLKQNIGAGLQIGATTATPGGAPASIAKSALIGGIQGAGIMGGKAAAENQSAQQIAMQGATGAAIGGTVSGITAMAGKFLERLGDKIQYSVIKPTKADIEDGFKIDTVKKYDLGGSLTTVLKKTEDRMDQLTAELNDKLAASPEHINLNEVYEKTLAKLSGNKFLSFGSNTQLDGALNQLKGELGAVGTDVSIPEAQIVKRAAGHYGAWQYGMFDPESTARQKVYNVFYGQLKEAIEQASPVGVKDINKQLSELIPVLNATIRRIPIAERNNALSLTDIIGLVGSAIEPRAMGITMLNLLSKSGAAANVLSKAGPGIESAAPVAGTGAALVGQAFSPTIPQAQTQQSQSPITSPKNTPDYGHVNEDGTITVKGPITGKDVTIDPTLGGGSIERAGAKILTKIASKVHPEDAAIMKDLTAAVAKHAGYHPSTKEMIALQRDAVTIWEKYLPDFPLPKTINGIANDFGRLLDYISIK